MKAKWKIYLGSLILLFNVLLWIGMSIGWYKWKSTIRAEDFEIVTGEVAEARVVTKEETLKGLRGARIPMKINSFVIGFKNAAGSFIVHRPSQDYAYLEEVITNGVQIRILSDELADAGLYDVVQLEKGDEILFELEEYQSNQLIITWVFLGFGLVCLWALITTLKKLKSP